jgi:hypothetical protein
MLKMMAAVFAAAVSASFFVTSQAFDQNVTGGVLRGTQPVQSASIATSVQKSAEQDVHGDGPARNVLCQQGWPYYEPSCLRVGNNSAGNAREVRVIAAERLAAIHAEMARR